MSCSRQKKGMLRAIGLIGAWLAAFVREDPSPRECFCNCTCSIEHRLSSAATSWQWELTKGLIFGFIGALITVGWKVVVLLIQKPVAVCKSGQFDNKTNYRQQSLNWTVG